MFASWTLSAPNWTQRDKPQVLDVGRRDRQPDLELTRPAKGPRMPRTYLQRIVHEALAIEQEQARNAGALGYRRDS